MVAQQPSACAQAMRGPVWRVALRTCILSLSLSHLRGIHAEAIRGGAGARRVSSPEQARAVLAANNFSQFSQMEAAINTCNPRTDLSGHGLPLTSDNGAHL